MRSIATIACILLVVLAGCNGMPTNTTDTSPGPSETPSEQVIEPYAPASTTLNTSQLIADHTAALNQSGSVTHTQRIQIRVNGNQTKNTTITYRADFNATQYHFTYAAAQENTTAALYATSNTSYSKQTRWNKTQYNQRSDPDITQFTRYGLGLRLLGDTSLRLTEVLRAGTWTQQGVESYQLPTGNTVGVTRFALTDTNTSAVAQMFGLNAQQLTIQHATGHLHVAPTGLIYGYDVRYRLSVGNSTSATITLSDSFSKVGTTDVSAPSWIDTAQQQETPMQPRHPQVSFSFSYSEANGTVTITHYGGDNLNATHVVLIVDGTRMPWSEAVVNSDNTPQTITAGDAATINVSTETTIRVQWTGGETPVTLGEYTVD